MKVGHCTIGFIERAEDGRYDNAGQLHGIFREQRPAIRRSRYSARPLERGGATLVDEVRELA